MADQQLSARKSSCWDSSPERLPPPDLSSKELALSYGPDSPGMPDLNPRAVEIFNASNGPALPANTETADGQVNFVLCHSISSDANLDNSCQGLPANQIAGSCDKTHLPTISRFIDSPLPDESEGYEVPDPDVLWLGNVGQMFSNVGEFLYRNLFQYSTASLKAVPPNPGTSQIDKIDTTPQLNDITVTVNSARFINAPNLVTFNEIASFVAGQAGAIGHNHTTVGKKDVGVFVLNSLVSCGRPTLTSECSQIYLTR